MIAAEVFVMMLLAFMGGLIVGFVFCVAAILSGTP